MQYLSQAYWGNVGDAERARLLATHYPVGFHPNTHDRLFIAAKDLYSGTYIEGVQGMGKTKLLENLIAHDVRLGNAIVVLDPHGDLITHCIAQLPKDKVAKTYLLDMEDTDYPFGVNIFGKGGELETFKNPVAQSQAVDRVMHVFEVLWPDILSQAHFPRFVRAATITLFANPGSTLVDMHAFLVDDKVRKGMLQAVHESTVRQFWQYYDSMSATQQRQQVEPLIGRLESIFMGRSIVRGIVGKRETSINFRAAIENREIIFIRLPLKTLTQDSRLIGTLLIAQIHAAIFSFSDIPEDRRPGFSLYVDEFQHFATPDFAEMFTEGRKFGVRVYLAHQYRGQMPTYLQQSTMTARTKVCFQTTPEDAREMAHVYIHGDVSMKPEDIDPKPIEHLLQYGSDNPQVQTFINSYLRPLQSQKRSGQIEIRNPGTRWDNLPFWMLSVKVPEDKPKVADPTPYLNHFLYEVMKTGDWGGPILPQIVYGFANCGQGFYKEFLYTAFHGLNKEALLTDKISYPHPLVVEMGNGGLRWTRPPDSGKEQLYHFLFHLRATMKHLAENPLGKKSTLSASEVASMLTQLPRRAAFVRSGDDVGVIYTEDTLAPCDTNELRKRYYLIRGQTRQKYCRPKEELARDTDVPSKPDEPPVSRWEEVQ
jgi:hypothetical protein